MNFWHMQLHPDQPNWNNEEKILNLGYIGLGEWKAGKSQIKAFQNMHIGDIVLIKRGMKPIALVEVIGASEYTDKTDEILWFEHRRKIRVYEYANEKMASFPQPRATLQKAKDPKTDSYIYIYNWFQKVLHKQFKKIELKNNDFKIDELYIDEYKMFKDFTLNLQNENNETLSLVIIVGKNGTGKTTLLEYLYNISINNKSYIKIFSTRDAEGLEKFDNLDIIIDKCKIIKGVEHFSSKITNYKKHIVYLPIDINQINDVEEEIFNYYTTIQEVQDLAPSKAIKEIQRFISDITIDLSEDFMFELSRIDIGLKRVFFKNKNGDEFNINELSTGEKTLFSKVLYLYLKRFKNKIILIDEPELSLHPNWQNKIVELYESFAIKNNCQIIITTHSPHIIGSVKSESLRVLYSEDNFVKVKNSFSNSYGLEFSTILTDIMGIESLRTPKVEKQLSNIKDMIIDNKYDTVEFKNLLSDIEENLGKDDMTLKLLRLEIDMRKRRCLK